LKKAEEKNISVKKSAFVEYGKCVTFYPGVEDWFDRINNYGAALGLNIHHYIVSSGIKEMIEGTRIKDKFERIYACSFLYNVDDIAKWPAVCVNYTNKTQFLYRINKGIFEVYDEAINDKMEEDKKAIPFSNMVYFGDGLTDVPCMKLVKDNGGVAVAVHKDSDRLSTKLFADGRVNLTVPANYEDGSKLDAEIKKVLDNIKERNNE
ncbi:MAG: haloacid dehalogenase-like hydrolase, partial [Clostridia bacterium]|nr:haloacid dehalogenase-like hydrolase [Clostridia bacterium]